MGQNVLIGYGNRIDAATLSGGSYVATLPLSNLQNRVISKKARTSDLLTTSTLFNVDIGADHISRITALIGHNFSLVAMYRIRASNNADMSSPLWDTGWKDVWPPVYGTLDLEWQALNCWSGRYLEEERAGYTWTLTEIIPSAINARYWRYEISDVANDKGYVQIGRPFIGDAWQTKVNMDRGASLGWETKSQVQESLGGTEYFQKRTPYRVARFNTSWMSENEGMSRAFDIQRRMGVTDEMLFVFDPDDTLHSLRKRMLCRIRQLSPVEWPFADLLKTGWELKELI